MPYAIRHRDGEWCVVKETDGTAVGCHPTRADALDQLRALYATEPELAGLDWAEQRIIAAAAHRWHTRYGLGGNRVAVLAATRLADPAPLTGDDLAWLDAVARDVPAHRHLSRDLAGRAWPRTAAIKTARVRRLSKELAAIDRRLGDRLYAMAATAMRDALRRAGVKAVVRAKNRGKTAALIIDGLSPAVLAAISTSPDELLDKAFAALQADAEAAIVDANRARVQAVGDAYDLDDDAIAELEDDPRADQRATWAAALLAAGLLRRARAALATAADYARRSLGVTVAEPVVPVPFVEVRTAMRVRDGWRAVQTITAGPNRTPEADAGVTLLPPEHGSTAIDELLGQVSGGTFTRFYEWVHGYFGEPRTPFEPHLALDGAEYDDDTRADALAADPSEWPYVAQYSTDDHDDCTCYEVITYEPAE